MSCMAIWIAPGSAQRNSRKKILAFDVDRVGSPPSVDYQFGCTWLALCFPDRVWPRLLDRPISIDVNVPRHVQHLQDFQQVKFVNCRDAATTESLAKLQPLPQLEAILLDQRFTSSTATAELPDLPRLRGLDVSGSARMCRRLAGLKSLENLRITEGPVDSRALDEIGQLQNLSRLSLDHIESNLDLSQFRKLYRLTELNVHPSELTADALENISSCSQLTELSIFDCKIDKAAIRHLGKLTSLTKLNLTLTNLADAHLVELGNLAELRELDLALTKVRNVRFLVQLKKLKTLNLYRTEISGDDLSSLVGLTQLDSLDLRQTKIDRQAHRYLCQMRQLRSLQLPRSAAEMKSELERALPHCEIASE